MQIEVRRDDNSVILVLSGRLTRGEHLDLLRENVSALLRDGYRDFVVDLESVSYVDSTGLGELVAIYSMVRREQAGVIRLAGLNERLHAPEQIPDPWSPTLRDSGWELQVGVAFGILLLIGVMIALR